VNLLNEIRVLPCRIRGHRIGGPCCNGAHGPWCYTCHEKEMKAAFQPDAYKVGDRLLYDFGQGAEEVIVERIEQPTTRGSKAWLMTRLASVGPAAGGGRVGAPDTDFKALPFNHCVCNPN